MSGSTAEFTINPDKFDFEKLSDIHKLSIDCTDEQCQDSQCLQHFLCKRAKNYQHSHLGITYMVSYNKKPIGYVTLSASSIHKDKIIQRKRPSTREGSIFPALIIVNFAIDKRLRKCGFGSYVLLWCCGLARITAEKIGCRYIILFARDAIDFYRKHEFQIAEQDDGSEFKMMYADCSLKRNEQKKTSNSHTLNRFQ